MKRVIGRTIRVFGESKREDNFRNCHEAKDRRDRALPLLNDTQA